MTDTIIDRIRELLLSGTLGSSGHQLIFEAENPDDPRALMDALLELIK